MNDVNRMETIRCSKTDYENLTAVCPLCNKENIFNRASDLKKFEPVSREIVQCEHCAGRFPIGNDTINEKYELMILDCYDLKRRKKYMYCIINLCQACEAFFVKGIAIKLLWLPLREFVFGKPFELYEHHSSKATDKTKKLTWLDVFNIYSAKLHNKLKSFTYKRLLNVFFDIYLNNKSFHSQKDIDKYIDSIDDYAKIVPKDATINSRSNGELQHLFMRLKKLHINELRNKVVHEEGFRPTLGDVERYLDEVRAIIFGIKRELNLEHEIMYSTISNIIASLGDH